jgi:hypothetical protein
LRYPTTRARQGQSLPECWAEGGAPHVDPPFSTLRRAWLRLTEPLCARRLEGFSLLPLPKVSSTVLTTDRHAEGKSAVCPPMPVQNLTCANCEYQAPGYQLLDRGPYTTHGALSFRHGGIIITLHPSIIHLNDPVPSCGRPAFQSQHRHNLRLNDQSHSAYLAVAQLTFTSLLFFLISITCALYTSFRDRFTQSLFPLDARSRLF